MVGELLTLDVQGEVLGFRAEPGGGGPHAVGQQVSQSLAAGDALDQFDGRRGVAPAQLQAAGILFAQQPLLVGFESEGDVGGRGDGVQPVAVAQVVHEDDAFQVVVEQQAAEAGQRLVLRAVRLQAGVAPFLDLHLLAAADGTGEAAVVCAEKRLRQRLPGGALRALAPTAAAPVLHRQIARRLGSGQPARRAQLAHGQGIVLDAAVGRLHRLAEAVGVVVRRPGAAAAHDDGLEIFRAHDRARAAAAGGAGLQRAADHHGGVVHQVLPCRADDRHLCLGVGLGQQHTVRGVAVLAPEMPGAAQFDGSSAAIHPQIDGVFGAAGDDEAVVAGGAQRRAPMAANVGFAPDTSERRAATPGGAATSGGDAAGEEAVEDVERAGGVQRRQGGVHRLVVQPGGVAAAQ